MKCIEACDRTSETYSAPSVNVLAMVALHPTTLTIHLDQRIGRVGAGIGLYLDLQHDGAAELFSAIAKFEAEPTWNKVIQFKALVWGGEDYDSEEPKLVTVTIHSGSMPDYKMVAHVE